MHYSKHFSYTDSLDPYTIPLQVRDWRPRKVKSPPEGQFSPSTFLPRSKRLLISWLQSPSAVILEPPEIKPATVSTVSLSTCHGVMGPDAEILVF